MSELVIFSNPICKSEKDYIFNLIFNYLGLPIKILFDDSYSAYETVISLDSKILLVKDSFFSQFLDKKWLGLDSMPIVPLDSFTKKAIAIKSEVIEPIPIIYGKNEWIESDNKIELGVDIFGSSFFMLSRYEEVVMSCKNDKFNRFPAVASLAFQENFLLRPIVNEYIELFWCAMGKLWSFKRKEHEFQIRYTCDVDYPFDDSIKKPFLFFRRIVVDIIRYESFRRLFASLKDLISQRDSNDTFEYLLRVLKEHNIKGGFYFILDKTSGFDGNYTFDDQRVRNLLKKINNEGHEIGLHPSFNTYLNKDQILKEFEKLRQVSNEESIIQVKWGGRQHFLRWSTPYTARFWEEAGLDYDSTLGYADHVGFRCGSCFEFKLYDVISRQKLNLLEYPLIFMECSLIDKRYMGKGYSKESYEIVDNLKHQCRLYNGTFTFLWHNSFFKETNDYHLFNHILS